MARLITTEDGRNIEYELADETTLGRSSDCTIRIATGKASRKHARIYHEHDNYFVEDLGSVNGTLVSGRKIRAVHKLKNGQVLRVGAMEFRFVDEVNDPLVGTMLGNYRIEARIGKGGMGTVYRAKQTTMDRTVALKVLQPAFAQREGFVDNFLSEARLAGKLSHPNIITVIDFGEANGHYFFSMEHIEGEDVQERIERDEKLTPELTVAIAIQVAGALAHAHEQLVIHQDIKPLNIMLDGEDTVKVADLGLAKMMHYGAAVDEDRPVFGTPEYIPPEVMRKLPPDPRSDIYSLAASMFHMVTGRPPFEGETPMAVVQQHLNSPVPDPRALAPNTPDALAELIMQGMSKDPARRPASCDEMVKSLVRIRKRTTAAAKPVAAAPRLPQSAQRPTPVVAPAPLKEKDKGTEALPMANPYQPIARAIMVGISVLAALVLAWGVAGFLNEKKSAAAKTAYTKALSAFDKGDLESAEKEFKQLRQDFPGLPEAAEAKAKLKDIKRRRKLRNQPGAREFRQIESGLSDRSLSPREATRRLKALLGQSIASRVAEQTRDLLTDLARQIPPSAQTPPEPTAGGEPPEPTNDKPTVAEEEDAMDAWMQVVRLVNQQVHEEKFGNAKRYLDRFIDSFAGTKAAIAAAGKRKKVAAEMTAVLNTHYNNGVKYRTAGDLADARLQWIELLMKASQGALPDKARLALAKLDTEANAKLFTAFAEAQVVFLQLNPGEITPSLAPAINELVDLPQGDAAKQVYEEVRAAGAFSRALSRVVANKQTKAISIIGVGLRVPTSARSGKVQFLDDGKPVTVDWSRVAMADIARLAPPETLTDAERLGAGVHFVARGHMGYARTYLQRLPKTGRMALLAKQARAHQGGRVMIDAITFTDSQRWSSVDGEWEFAKNRCTGTGEKARNDLNDRSIAPQNISISFTSAAADGSAALLLSQTDNQYIAVRHSGDSVSLEFASRGAPLKRIGTAAASTPLRLVVEANVARVFADDKKIAELPVPKADTWQTRLRLEVIGGSGSFGPITVAIGSPAEAKDEAAAEDAE